MAKIIEHQCPYALRPSTETKWAWRCRINPTLEARSCQGLGCDPERQNDCAMMFSRGEIVSPPLRTRVRSTFGRRPTDAGSAGSDRQRDI